MRVFLSSLVLSLIPLAHAAPAYADGEVTLLAVRGVDCPPVSGCFRDPTVKGVVEVANLAYEKRVEVVFEPVTDVWDVAEGSYLGPSRPGYELWWFEIDASVIKFAVAYTVDGVTYWDNNHGHDYTGTRYGDTSAILGPTTDVFVGSSLQWRFLTDRDGDGKLDPAGYDPEVGTVSGSVWTRTAAPGEDAEVVVVYTDDNWATVKTTTTDLYADYPTGVSLWFFTAAVNPGTDPAAIELAVAYDRASGTVWDSNYGHNYVIGTDLLLAR